MDYESSQAGAGRTLYRRDPKSLLLRSYLLSVAECENLVGQGFDPETVLEEELSRRAIRICEYDSQERLIMVMERFASTPMTFTYQLEEVSTEEGGSECQP
jgi:hypothetical protein